MEARPVKTVTFGWSYALRRVVCLKLTSVKNMLQGAFAALRQAASFSANDTLLPSDLADRGIEHFGDDTHLACFRASLARGSPVAVVAIGGSISAGSSYSVRYGGSGAWLYHSKVAQSLRVGIPWEKVVAHHNGALPATGPAFFEHCVEGQLRFSHPSRW